MINVSDLQLAYLNFPPRNSCYTATRSNTSFLDGVLVTTGYLIHSSLAVVGVHTDRVHQNISWAILLTSIFWLE